MVIGDRQTGKSTVCIDLKSKEFYDAGSLCLYICCNWTKASTVAGIAKMLEESNGVCLPAMPMQLCPAPAIGEYFRDSGRPALIVYDDLSKQAVAYREVSLY
jgi:F-type H+-transporting ATPase subunit alpha